MWLWPLRRVTISLKGNLRMEPDNWMESLNDWARKRAQYPPGSSEWLQVSYDWAEAVQKGLTPGPRDEHDRYVFAYGILAASVAMYLDVPLLKQETPNHRSD